MLTFYKPADGFPVIAVKLVHKFEVDKEVYIFRRKYSSVKLSEVEYGILADVCFSVDTNATEFW